MSVRFLLDTNVISELNKKIPNESVIERIVLHQEEVATASLVVHELLYGAFRLPLESPRRRFLLDFIADLSLRIPVLEYDLETAQWHAEERARLSKIGKIPAFVDAQIASIAFCNSLILVTNNVSDFEDFEGLAIENWFI